MNPGLMCAENHTPSPLFQAKREIPSGTCIFKILIDDAEDKVDRKANARSLAAPLEMIQDDFRKLDCLQRAAQLSR